MNQLISHLLTYFDSDMKAPNVMMSFNSSIKIIDFGLAIDMSNGPKTEMAGSPFW